VAFPTFILGPALNTLTWARRLHQSRRRVKLTVHRAILQGPIAMVGDTILDIQTDSYFINITNASRDRDIVITHVWIDSDPAVQVHDPALPLRLQHSAPWSTSVAVEDVPADPDAVPWLARCLLSPDDKIIKSRPNRNVPPSGVVPRG
jgi:hypothetical protein